MKGPFVSFRERLAHLAGFVREMWPHLLREIGPLLVRLVRPVKLDEADPLRAIRSLNRIGVALIILLVGGFGGWAATSELSGAVIAHGTVVVESNVKKVQHPTGGVVGEILVHDGSEVTAGQVLIRLDDTVTRSTLGVVRSQLDELLARQARLLAERDGADTDTIVFPDDITSRRTDKSVAAAIAGEQKLFEARRGARSGQRAQLRERIVQSNEEIRGLTSQQDGKESRGEIDRFGARGRQPALHQKPRFDFASDTIAARQGASARRAGPVRRGNRARPRQDQRNGIVDSPARSGFPHRRAQRPARNRRQGRRAQGARDGGAGSVETHRNPRAAGRLRQPACGAHRRWRRRYRRNPYADRAARRCTRRRGEGSSAGHRSGHRRRCRHRAHSRWRSAHQPRPQRASHPRVRRPYPRSGHLIAGEPSILSRLPLAAGGPGAAARRSQAGSRDAGRSVQPDLRAHAAAVPAQAVARTVRPDLPRALSAFVAGAIGGDKYRSYDAVVTVQVGYIFVVGPDERQSGWRAQVGITF